MSATTRLALAILGASAILGLLGDALLRETPWGVNAALWTAAVLVAVAVLRPSRARRPALLLALPFAAAVAWRDSATLVALDLVAVAAAIGIAGLRNPYTARLRDYAARVGTLLAEIAVAALRLVGFDVRWAQIPPGRVRTALALARGIAIAVPLLLLFGALLASADAVFDRLVRDALDIGDPGPHLASFALASWTAAGVLRYAVWPRLQPRAGAEARRSLGLVEIAVILGVLDALLALFVAVQFRSFFGDHEYVETATGLTYAEYARRGFFQLVAVAALSLPLVLVSSSLLRTGRERDARIHRVLAGVLVALVTVVMASALQRMRLYQEAYGLTELRLYTTAFTVWLAVVFVWLALTVLQGRPRRFAVGATGAAFAVLALLNALNPNALIARTNADRAGKHRFDYSYALSLGADAVPALVAAVPSLPQPERAVVARRLLASWSRPHDRDWRSWNWGREQAWRAVEENRPLLRSALRRHSRPPSSGARTATARGAPT